MKPVTSSAYTFPELRSTGTLYVDKTAYLHQLVTTKPKGIFFFARPRRFGKSLTLSTFKAIFEGKRELFKGLAIDSLDYDWKKYPVIHLDMSLYCSDTKEGVIKKLHECLNECARLHKLTITGEEPDSRFNSLITLLAERDGPIVILIDEYDKPILEKINEPSVATEIRNVLRRFYGVAKATERFQRFLFITGVASFAKVSFFSDLNHASDFSRHPDFATMFGYTQEELRTNFSEHLDAAAKKGNMPLADFLEKFRRWYNGFCFHHAAPTVYNPVSVAKFFENAMEFKSFWFETGTSRQIVEIAKNKGFDFSKDLIPSISEDSFSQFDVEAIKTLPLLVQSGYFTIKSAEENFLCEMIYQLGFPNFEVERGFEKFLLTAYVPAITDGFNSQAIQLRNALISEEHEKTIAILNRLLAEIPGKLHVPLEAYYQSVVYTAVRFSGLDVRSEEWVAGGIIDNTVTFGNLVYIFEFKIKGKVKDALDQINNQDYAAKFRNSGKKILLFGVTLDIKKKCVADWKVVEEK